MPRKAVQNQNDNNYQSVPQPQTPFYPNTNSSSHIPISGNPGLMGEEGDPGNYDTPHQNRLGIGVSQQPTEPKPETPPYVIPSPPMA